MGMNIKIISKEVIKPSSPTRSHLTSLKLSFLDQMAPPHYVPIILFYQSQSQSQSPASNIEIATLVKNYSQSLKQSLSQSLTRFYPLAGRLNDDGVSIDCNDAGVEYVESRVEGQLILQVIENPNMEQLTKFLPLNPFDHTNSSSVLVSIQTNFFACGGLAVAVCVSHKIADGSSMVSFINSWASQSLGKTESIQNPDFDSAYKLFPPIDLSGFNSASGITQEHVITKQLVFDKMKLSKLKREMATTTITPTRVEAVSAFIWKNLINVSKAKNINGSDEKLYAGVHALNLRPKTSPPLGDLAFGNIYCTVTAVVSSVDEQVVERLRDAIRKIDGEYVEGLGDGKRYMEAYKKINEEYSKGGGNMEFCCFTSWCRFPYYDIDYGWGKPVWVCITTMPLKNFVVLMSTRDGDGIEAWVSLAEPDMAVLEAEHDRL